jgi:hypothetical protein
MSYEWVLSGMFRSKVAITLIIAEKIHSEFYNALSVESLSMDAIYQTPPVQLSHDPL